MLDQLTYGALLSGRTSMVGDSAATAKKALTIAVRYAAVRRQFSSGKNQVGDCRDVGMQWTNGHHRLRRRFWITLFTKDGLW
jgi:hypothetical protein